MIIPRSFYERDTLTVARELIGQKLVREAEGGITSAIIVETEAYLGPIDDAAHSYKGKSERVKVQYGIKGLAYVYLIYGMYWCFNITSGAPGVPEVVLIRALEPVNGIELMESRRRTNKSLNLCSGPGKLCMAMDIGKMNYGEDLTERGGLWLEYGDKSYDVASSPRIGIDYAVECRDMPWRFYAVNCKFVSQTKSCKHKN